MYEIWSTKGRTRTVVARFRLLKDAETYLAQHVGPGELEIMGAGRESRPRSKDTSAPPPSSDKPRRNSGIREAVIGRAVRGAAEHPDEFIADQIDAEKAGTGSSD